MNSLQVMLFGVVFAASSSLALATFWDSHSDEANRNGHWLMDAVLLAFWDGFCALSRWLYRAGLPAWAVNLPRRFVPDALMRAAAYAHLRRELAGPRKTPESSRGCTAGEPSRDLSRGSSVSATLPDLGVADPLPPAGGLPWNCRKVLNLQCPDDGAHSSRSEDAPAAAACIVLTEEQRSELAYAATCQLHELATGEEADEPEVQEAIGHLYAALRLLEAGRPL